MSTAAIPPSQFLTAGELLAAISKATPNSNPSRLSSGVSSSQSGGTAQTEAKALLSNLPQLLPSAAGQVTTDPLLSGFAAKLRFAVQSGTVPSAGGQVTTYPRLSDLVSFLSKDPSDIAAKLKSAVQSGTVTADQYRQIEWLLKASSGSLASSNTAAQFKSSVTPVGASSIAQPAVGSPSAQLAKDVLSGSSATFVPNNAPAAVGYRFQFGGDMGKAFQNWLNAHKASMTVQPDFMEFTFNTRRTPAFNTIITPELFDKMHSGQILSEEEYKSVWKAIREELWRVGGELGGTDPDKGIIATVAENSNGQQEVDLSKGYLVDKDWKLQWYAPGANAPVEIRFPRDNESLEVPASLCLKATSSELRGEYTIASEKRGPVLEFLKSLPKSKENEKLIAAVESGKLTALQKGQIMTSCSEAINFAQGRTVQDLYLNVDEFFQIGGM